MDNFIKVKDFCKLQTDKYTTLNCIYQLHFIDRKNGRNDRFKMIDRRLYIRSDYPCDDRENKVNKIRETYYEILELLGIQKFADTILAKILKQRGDLKNKSQSAIYVCLKNFRFCEYELYLKEFLSLKDDILKGNFVYR